MALIDSNLVFMDSAAVTASGNSAAVGLTSFSHPGHVEPIPVIVRVVEAFTNCTSVKLELAQSDSKDGTYAVTPGSEITVLLADLKKVGNAVGWRFLPRASKPWLRINYTVMGTAPTQGKIFAAVMREDPLPYTEGMYIDAGVVKG